MSGRSSARLSGRQNSRSDRQQSTHHQMPRPTRRTCQRDAASSRRNLRIEAGFPLYAFSPTVQTESRLRISPLKAFILGQPIKSIAASRRFFISEYTCADGVSRPSQNSPGCRRLLSIWSDHNSKGIFLPCLFLIRLNLDLFADAAHLHRDILAVLFLPERR